MIDLHEDLHRLILRKRWMRWSKHNYRQGDYRYPDGRHMMLSARLTRSKPTFDERKRVEIC